MRIQMLARVFVAIAIAIASTCLVNAQPGLVSYWPGDGNANDIVGSNNGSFQGSAAYATGVRGQAFSLDGSSRYIEVPDSPSLSITGNLTLSSWIKISSNIPQQAIIEKYDVPAPNGYLLRLYQGKVLATVCNVVTCSQPPAVGSTTVTTGAWHHVAAVFDGTSIKVYLDGILDGSSVTNYVPTDGGTSLKIGARGDDANTRLGGLIDDVAIFNRALAATEIQGLLDGLDLPESLPPTQSRAYLANQATNSVEVMDLATNTLIENIPVGTHPAHIAVNSAGTRVYVTNVTSNNVSVIDAGTSTVIATVPVGDGPTGIAVTPDDSRIYIVNDRGNSVFVMDASTNQVISSIGLFGNPEGIAITPEGTRAYVASINGNCVFVIDTTTNALSATIPIPSLPPYPDILPSGIKVSPDGSRVLVTNLRGAALTVISTSTNSILTTLVLGGFNARSVDFSPDGNTAYVAVEGGGNLAVVDLTTFTITTQIHTGTSPFSIDVSADGKRAYIADYNSPSLAVVDLVTKTVVAPLPIISGRAFVALWEVPPTDSTPPAIETTITGTHGDNGWYTSNVEVSWLVADEESAVSLSTGCTTATVTSDTSGVTFTCSATSAGGTRTESVTIKRDANTPSISCGSADGLWHASDVLIACTSNDGVSGLAIPTDSSFTLSTNFATGSETGNASTGSHQVCDSAGNCSTASSVGGNKVDKKAPTISVTSPTAGNYLLNQSVVVAFTCSDGGSGVSSCNGTTANGGTLDTASVGSKTFAVNATDNVGNVASPTSVGYTVKFGVSVLFDQTKAHKSGSTVPVKIRLVDANVANVSSASVTVHAVSVIQTSSQASTTLDDSGNSNPDFDFRYDTTFGGYIFNLKTTGYGTGSYLLNFIANASPQTYSVGFQVRQ